MKLPLLLISIALVLGAGLPAVADEEERPALSPSWRDRGEVLAAL